MDVTTFIWMFVVLKIPIVAALWLIWYAIQEPEPERGRRLRPTAARTASPTTGPPPRARRGAGRTPRPRPRGAQARAHRRAGRSPDAAT